MAKHFLRPGIRGPDFYMASIGRSGSTMLCNWLSDPPEQLAFTEPFFLHPSNPRLLRIQLEDFGIPVADDEWSASDPSPSARFHRIMAPRLVGKRWGFKEVLCDEHFRTIDHFDLQRVVITVRDIADVALSLFEKHRLQDSLDRFDDRWVEEYCRRESSGMLRFRELLDERGIASLVARYEDFTRSGEDRQAIARFVGWTPGGEVDRHLERFDRGFELERHGRSISAKGRDRADRALDPSLVEAADELASRCAAYQSAFGYA